MTRERAIEILEHLVKWGRVDDSDYGITDDSTLDALEMAISALSENKGKWKKTYLDHVAMGERPSILYCSVCCRCVAYPTNFCPNCGADMRGE